MFKIGDSCWLTPGEQHEAIAGLVEDNLINWDNKRALPLKSGGTTDIYANLRLMRNNPRAIIRLANLFSNPVRRLGVDRIVEVPEAVSPLAGHLSVLTGIPVVTVREEAKEGRVVKGRFIGDLKRGDNVVIIDDVITDGASKFTALKELRSAGANIKAIVVLVDRQQGWKKKLAETGFGDIPVWAGMTLHDMRRYLIENGLMQRCNPDLEAKNPLIVALDGKSWEEVLPIVDRLRPSGCILKANDLLDSSDINEGVSRLSVYGRVMIDRKFHDIPNTVGNYCKNLRKTPPWAFTVHASGGTEMIKAAVEAFAGTSTIVLSVTLLTSIGAQCSEIFTRQPLAQVETLAEIAWKAGARGFVCSGEEAQTLRTKYPEATIVIPALRSPGADANEQKRTATFAGVKDVGNFFVGGRQFLTAKDPVAEILRVLKEELLIEV